MRQEARGIVFALDACCNREIAVAVGWNSTLKLKERGLNPGTTADFVVATLFAERLVERETFVNAAWPTY